MLWYTEIYADNQREVPEMICQAYKHKTYSMVNLYTDNRRSSCSYILYVDIGICSILPSPGRFHPKSSDQRGTLAQRHDPIHLECRISSTIFGVGEQQCLDIIHDDQW